jgi:hypothetical protein
MFIALRIFKQIWSVLVSLDRLRPTLPLKGKIRAFTHGGNGQ